MGFNKLIFKSPEKALMVNSIEVFFAETKHLKTLDFSSIVGKLHDLHIRISIF